MPEISLFYGIRVTMYYDDHNPPHFYAEYNGNKAIIEIDEARVIKGALPSRQLKLILAWCVLHGMSVRRETIQRVWISIRKWAAIRKRTDCIIFDRKLRLENTTKIPVKS